MAATNFTPIILYHTTTASAAPTAGNLNNGELAINITDGKLFYKDNGGTVQVIATKGTGTIGGSNTQVQYNSSGALAGSANFTFNGTTATINTLNLTNALGTAYGGTALTTYTQGDLVYASAANTLAKLGIGANTYILTSTGSVPQWSAPSAITVSTATNLAGGAAGSVPYQSGAGVTTFLSIGTANQVLTSSGTAPQWSNLSSLGVTSLSFGTTGLTPSTATQGAITVAGTLATTNGGTGLTSFTANGVFYASSTSAVGQSANLTFDGTTLVASNLTDSSLTTGRVVYTTTGGNLTDSANLLYSGTDLTVYGITVGRGAGAVASNTVMGLDALIVNTTGSNNSAFGTQALRFNTTGIQNSAFGYQALYSNTTGNFNSAGSMFALFANTTGSYNTAIGLSALEKNTTANSNVAVGYQAAYNNTTGLNNSVLGTQAFFTNTTGQYNVAVGTLALYSSTTASNNTAVGYYAGYTNTTGTNLTALGQAALVFNTTGSQNVAVGNEALRSNTTASNNTAVGYQAGYSNQTGTRITALGYQSFYTTTVSDNTGLGFRAGYLTTTGDANTAVGSRAFESNTTGSNNSAVGYYALNANTTGASNSGFGLTSLQANTTGSYNTALGQAALYSNTTASNNTAVGYQAGYSITTGANNTAIGTQALYANTTVSNNTAVGYQTGSSNTTGAGLVFVGYRAGNGNTTGSYNTFLGENCGVNNTTGDYNNAMGAGALLSNTTGAQNSAIGMWSLNANTTGSDNTGLGFQSGFLTTVGTRVTAIGSKALRNNTTGSFLVAVGFEAGLTHTTGQQSTYVGDRAGYSCTVGGNTFIGAAAGYSVTTGTKNTFIGGGDSTSIFPSGYYITTGSANTILGNYNGNQGGLDIRTANNYIVLSDGDGNPRGYFDNNGTWIVPGTSGVNTAKEYNVTRWSLSTTMLENNNYQRFKVTIGATRVSAYARIRAMISPDGGISYFYGSEVIVSMGRADGGASAALMYSFNGPNVSINEPQTSGNDVLFGLTVSNNGTGTSPTVNIVVDYLSASPTSFTWASVSGTTAGGTSLLGLTKFNPSANISNAVVVSGNGLGLGNTTPSSGTGITFPATQSASSDANTLDDYEEGTFTPSYAGSVSNPTVGYNQRNGRYVKIGQLVQVTIEMETTSVSGGSGDLYVTGLPFTALNDRYVGNAVTGYAINWTTRCPRSGYLLVNSTTIGLTSDTSATGQTNIGVANLTTTGTSNYLIMTATYRASA